MIIKKSGGRWQLSLLASVVISAFFLNTAYAWQQEYIVDTQPGLSTERYTWDSDHQPDYNDILSQRIQSSQRALGLEVNLAEETPVGRLGSAGEVARALLFLAGEDAGYITGQVFGVNGGLVI